MFSEHDAKKMFEETGCDGIMMGRGALGNPDIFGKIAMFLKSGVKGIYPTKEHKVKSLKQYIDLAEKYNIKPTIIKKQALYFLRGFGGSVEMRRVIARSSSVEEILNVLDA